MVNEVNLVLNNNNNNIEKNENSDDNKNDDFLTSKKNSNLILNKNLSKNQHSGNNETIFYSKKFKSKKTTKQLPSKQRTTAFTSLQSELNCRSKVWIIYNF